MNRLLFSFLILLVGCIRPGITPIPETGQLPAPLMSDPIPVMPRELAVVQEVKTVASPIKKTGKHLKIVVLYDVLKSNSAVKKLLSSGIWKDLKTSGHSVLILDIDGPDARRYRNLTSLLVSPQCIIIMDAGRPVSGNVSDYYWLNRTDTELPMTELALLLLVGKYS